MHTHMEKIVEWALRYHEAGWTVIPIGWDEVKKGWKKPLIKWKERQISQRTTAEEIQCWWKEWSHARIGIVTGSISGIVAVDIDPKNGGKTEGLHLPPTLVANTGGGGWHYIYKHPKSLVIPNSTDWPKKGVDIRGDGGFIVVAPSLHASGKEYEWAQDFDTECISECPDWLLTSGAKVKTPIIELLKGVPEGKRNDSAARVIGSILAGLPTEEWKDRGWERSKNWNNRCSPPMEEKELLSVFESIASRELKRRTTETEAQDNSPPPEKRASNGQLAREFIEYSGIELFHDHAGKTYARINCNTHKEVWPCDSTELRRRLELFCYKKRGEPVSKDTISSMLNVIDAKARHEGQTKNVGLRIAKNDTNGVHGISYDLSDRCWQMVTISENGWTIGQDENLIFRRYNHTGEQVTPVKNGDLKEVLKFVNIKNLDEQLLFLCYLVSCFVPDIAHPILVMNGQKGSSKSTIMRMIKMIIDPSPLIALSFAKKPDDLAIIFSQNWVTAFDNVSDISNEMSDMLCKVCTGESFAKRKLYTDEDSCIVSYQRCVIINGINNPAEKPDLLDRIILFNIEPISKENRKSLTEIMENFNKALPSILGGIFDTLSRAIKEREVVSKDSLSRLADFDLWGRAIARALGHSENDFKRAINANTTSQNQEAIKQSPLALLLLAWGQKQTEGTMLEMTASELLVWLKPKAENASIDTRAETWPKSASALSRKLNEIAPNLADYGIRIFHTGDKRKICIRKNAVNAVNEKNETITAAKIIEKFGEDVPNSN